ncbi:MAG: SUMF1/EgtB/PvdO family nonheme iron enzyme [Bryobacteraceae bacterium]
MLLSTTAEKQVLQTRLDEARARTDELFRLLRPGAIYERPIPDRHRLIFYLGHLEAFDWNQVCRGVLGMSSFHPEFDKLFEFGIDPEPGNAPADGPFDWPGVPAIQDYNAKVRRKLDEALPDTPEHIVQVALEHRMMHAETLAYLLHNLDYQYKVDGPAEFATGPAATNRMIEIPAGAATLGQEPGLFGWDNEFPRHSVDVAAFSIAKYKVTNAEYLEFVRAGAGAHGAPQTKPPHFWIEQNGEYVYRGMFQSIPLPLDWPVYVTQKEAQAYATWRGKALPTEAQFHRAAYGTREGRDDRPFPWGLAEPMFAHGNFDFHRWEPLPVAANEAGNSAFGVSQMLGNGWEWTSTVFSPFEGFRAFDFYPGYSASFFDDAHYVIKGASPRTAACFLRKSFRNWFRPNYPYVYSGFRLVEN